MRTSLINAQRWGPIVGLVVAFGVGFLVFQRPEGLGIIFLIGIAALLIGFVCLVFFSSLYGRLSDRRKGPMPIPVLGGKSCAILLAGYAWDKRKEEFDAAVANFLSLDAAALKAAERYVFQYYKDYEDAWKSIDDEFKPVKSSGDIWKHVKLGSEPRVFRSRTGEIYISIECSCDWEPEHGMEIVFKDGRKLVKVGPVDGNPTNANASGDHGVEHTIYKA